MKISRRHFNAAVGASLAFPAFLAKAAAEGAYLKELHAAAQKEGELNWYIVHATSERAETMSRLFTQRYPGVRVNVVRTTAQVAYQRLSQDMRAGVANCDVFASTDMSHFIDLKRRGALLKYAPRWQDRVDERFQNLDPDGYFHSTGSALVSLIYNPNRVPAGKAPTSWSALADHAWKGQLAVGHPGFSGMIGTWLVAMVDLYGEGFIEQLAANSPHIGRSIVDASTTVISGERTVGVSNVSLTLLQQARGNPIEVSYMDEGCILIVLPATIMGNAPHPNAAKLFMEWLGSEEYAALVVEDYNVSMLKGFPPRQGVRPLSEIKTIQPATERIINGIPELTELWRDKFGV